MTEPTAGNAGDAIAAANEQSMALLRAQDGAGGAALYTEDGQLMPPSAEVLTGREGIQESLVEIDEVEDQGETAAEVSTFELQGEEGTELDRDSDIPVWCHAWSA